MRGVQPNETADQRRRHIHAERRAQQIVLILIMIKGWKALTDKIGENRVAHQPIGVGVKQMRLAAEQTKRDGERGATEQGSKIYGRREEPVATARRRARQGQQRERASSQNDGAGPAAEVDGDQGVGNQEQDRPGVQQVDIARIADARGRKDGSVDRGAGGANRVHGVARTTAPQCDRIIRQGFAAIANRRDRS